jgi:hypothetical protein
MLAPRKLPPYVVETIAYLKAKTREDAQKHREAAIATMRAANEMAQKRECERYGVEPGLVSPALLRSALCEPAADRYRGIPDSRIQEPAE